MPNRVEGAYLLPILKSMNFRIFLHNTSDQECPFKGSLIVPIYCALILIAGWSQSMWTGFGLDKTKLED